MTSADNNSNGFLSFAKRTLNNREALATALGKLFLGPQGPAAAELMQRLLAEQRSSHTVELSGIMQIHLGRMYREHVLSQMVKSEETP